MLDPGSNRELQTGRRLQGASKKTSTTKSKSKSESSKKSTKKKKTRRKRASDDSPEGVIYQVVKSYLALTEKDRSDWDIVKNVTDQVKDLFAHRNGPGGRIYIGAFTTLTPEESVKVKTFRVKDKDGKRIGFNRATKPRKLREILAALLTVSSNDHQLTGTKKSAVYTFAPAFLARVFNPETQEWELYDLDGQHRRHAHIIAGVPFVVFTIDMDLETARYNFILHNTKQTKVDRKTVIQGSSNPQATKIRQFSATYDASISQIDRLLCGLKNGGTMSGMNFNDKDADLDPEIIDRATSILDVWSDHKRWEHVSAVPKAEDRTSGHIYSGGAVLQALGWVIRDRPNLHDDDLRHCLAALRDQSELWYPSGKLNSIYGSAQHDIREIYHYLDKHWKKIKLPRRKSA